MTTFERMMEPSARLKTIKRFDGETIDVNEDSPIGCVELHQGGGFGPGWLLITVFGDMKVAIPATDGGDYVCKLLGKDRIGTGRWYPFSVLQDAGIFERSKRDFLRQGVRKAELKCFVTHDTFAWLPIPRDWNDAD